MMLHIVRSKEIITINDIMTHLLLLIKFIHFLSLSFFFLYKLKLVLHVHMHTSKSFVGNVDMFQIFYSYFTLSGDGQHRLNNVAQ